MELLILRDPDAVTKRCAEIVEAQVTQLTDSAPGLYPVHSRSVQGTLSVSL